MAGHDTLAPFDSSKESWSHSVERLGFYFVANDVEGDDKKRSILLSICGHQTFKLIRSLLDAQALETKSYDDIVKDNYNGCRNEFYIGGGGGRGGIIIYCLTHAYMLYIIILCVA